MAKAIKLKNITALIHRNFRDTASQPKVLITDIQGIERDHMWIEITDMISKFIPRSNRKPSKVQFDCQVREYVTYRPDGEHIKQGAINLCNIIKL